MAHANSGRDCPSCAEKLKDVHPLMVQWFYRVKQKWPDAHISWGFRSQADQDQAVRDGRSKDPWPTSKHNHMDEGVPESLALDLFQMDENGVGIFSPKFYLAVSEWAKNDSVKTRWGGSFPHLHDYDHFELILGPA